MTEDDRMVWRCRCGSVDYEDPVPGDDTEVYDEDGVAWLHCLSCGELEQFMMERDWG